MEIFMVLSAIEQILLVIAIFTGLVQMALLSSMVIRGGVVTIWYGVATVACIIAIILI